MCEVLVWSFDAITAMNWHEFFKTLAAVATAIIACMALRNWKRQDKAKREVAFLDELIEAVQNYTHSLSPLIASLTVLRIVIHGTSRPPEGVIDAGAIRDFIKADRAFTFTSNEKEMEPARIAALKLDALVKKGTVFRFPNYGKCQTAVDEMRHLLNLFETVTATLGSTYVNHEHPQVVAQYESFAAIINLDLRSKSKAGNEKFLQFATSAFQRIYG